MVVALGFSTRLPSSVPDGEGVYKSNCTRCHITIRTYPKKMSRSIVRHMRIKALLTESEAEAVLAYLSDNYSPAPKRSTGKVPR